MDTLSAFEMGKAAQGSPQRVFDWDKAAHLIVERSPRVASAGLRNDWEWTGGRIYQDGAPVPREETYTYLSSNWAIPELSLDDEIVECWCHTDQWDSDTYWPESAVAILNRGGGGEADMTTTTRTGTSNRTWHFTKECSRADAPELTCDIGELDHYGDPTGDLYCRPHGEIVGYVSDLGGD